MYLNQRFEQQSLAQHLSSNWGFWRNNMTNWYLIIIGKNIIFSEGLHPSKIGNDYSCWNSSALIISFLKMLFGACRLYWQTWKEKENVFLATCKVQLALRYPPCGKMHIPSGSRWITASGMGARSQPGHGGHVSPTLYEPRTGSPQIPESFSLNHVPNIFIILWETSGWAQMGSGKLQKGRRWYPSGVHSQCIFPRVSSWNQMAPHSVLISAWYRCPHHHCPTPHALPSCIASAEQWGLRPTYPHLSMYNKPHQPSLIM